MTKGHLTVPLPAALDEIAQDFAALSARDRLTLLAGRATVGEVLAGPDDAPYRFGLADALSPLRLRGMARAIPLWIG